MVPFWSCFGNTVVANLVLFWSHFGNSCGSGLDPILAPFWNFYGSRLGALLVPFWNYRWLQFGAILVPFCELAWCQVGPIIGIIFGIVMVPGWLHSWCHFGISLGPVRSLQSGRFRTSMFPISVPTKIGFGTVPKPKTGSPLNGKTGSNFVRDFELTGIPKSPRREYQNRPAGGTEIEKADARKPPDERCRGGHMGSSKTAPRMVQAWPIANSQAAPGMAPARGHVGFKSGPSGGCRGVEGCHLHCGAMPLPPHCANDKTEKTARGPPAPGGRFWPHKGGSKFCPRSGMGKNLISGVCPFKSRPQDCPFHQSTRLVEIYQLVKFQLMTIRSRQVMVI